MSVEKPEPNLQIVIGIPSGLASYSLWASRSSSWTDLRTLPDLSTCLLHVLVSMLCHDVWFYYGHRYWKLFE